MCHLDGGADLQRSKNNLPMNNRKCLSTVMPRLRRNTNACAVTSVWKWKVRMKMMKTKTKMALAMVVHLCLMMMEGQITRYDKFSLTSHTSSNTIFKFTSQVVPTKLSGNPKSQLMYRATKVPKPLTISRASDVEHFQVSI